MKIPSKLIEEVASRVAGEDVIPLVRTLKNRKDVSEFKLATETKKEINLVRNMLYRLYNANLVTSIKKKDKKKGWYIYYWTFNTKQLRYLAVELKRKRLEKLKERLEREEAEQYYVCDDKCIRLDFEQSTNFEFKCPECGKLVGLEDNTERIQQIQKEIKEVEKDLKKK